MVENEQKIINEIIERVERCENKLSLYKVDNDKTKMFLPLETGGITFDKVILSDENKKKFEVFIAERKNKQRIRNYNLRPMNSLLFWGAPGSGKAVCYNTKIITPTGYKLAKDIKVGDTVYDGNGEMTKIVGVYPQGKIEVYRITFEDETYVEVSLDHINRVYEGKTEQKDILTSELIEYYKKNREYNHWIKRPMNIEHKQKEYAKIQCISKEGHKEECICFMVASSDHTYLVNDFIPTHNTLSAKALTNELQIPIFTVDVSQIKGSSSPLKKMKEVFDFVETQGECILFLDEGDCLLSSRNGKKVSEETMELTNYTMQWINEKNESKTNEIIFIVASNFLERIDEAMLTRFQMQFSFQIPGTLMEIVATLVHKNKMFKLWNDVSDETIKILTEENKNGKKSISIRELEFIRDRVFKKNILKNPNSEVIDIYLSEIVAEIADTIQYPMDIEKKEPEEM